MTSLKLYGIDSPMMTYIKSKLKEFISFHQLDINIQNIKQINELVSKRLESVPAYSIDNDDAVSLSHKDVNAYLLELCKLLIHQAGFGTHIRRISAVFDPQALVPDALLYAQVMSQKSMYIIDAVHVVDPYVSPDNWVHPNLDKMERHFVGDFHHVHVVQPIKFAKGKCKNADNPCAGCHCSAPLYKSEVSIVSAIDLANWHKSEDKRIYEALMHPKAILMICSPISFNTIHHIFTDVTEHARIPDVLSAHLNVHSMVQRESRNDLINHLDSLPDKALVIIDKESFRNLSEEKETQVYRIIEDRKMRLVLL